MRLTSQVAKFDALQSLGFSTPNYGTVSVADLPDFYERQKVVRDSFDVDVDGTVLSANDTSVIAALGYVSNGARRCAKAQIALKYPSGTAVTRVVAIEYSTDGAAHMGPVAIFEPIHLLGAEIKRASFKSIAFMTDRKERVKYFRSMLREKDGIDKSQIDALAEDYAGSEECVGVGSVIEVARSGDVIPTICRVVSNLQAEVTLPTTCPACGSGVERNGAFLDCTNDECKAKEAARMVKFLSTLGVKGLAQDSLVLYAESGVTVLDFFQDDWATRIPQKISAHPEGISLNIWAKVAAQLTELQA